MMARVGLSTMLMPPAVLSAPAAMIAVAVVFLTRGFFLAFSLALSLALFARARPLTIVGQQRHDTHPGLDSRLEIASLSVSSSDRTSDAAGHQGGSEATCQTDKTANNDHGCDSRRERGSDNGAGGSGQTVSGSSTVGPARSFAESMQPSKTRQKTAF
jgi:hypothetical protein